MNGRITLAAAQPGDPISGRTGATAPRSPHRLTWLAGMPAAVAIPAARDGRGNGRKAHPGREAIR